MDEKREREYPASVFTIALTPLRFIFAAAAIGARFLNARRGAMILVLAAWAGAGAAETKRPNLMIYLSDDQGQEFTGCYGNPVIQTPHTDGLARQGTRFLNVFAASPTCSPSRAALYTGLYPARNGTMGNHTDCKPGIKSLPTYLKALGYRVVIANKADVRPKEVFDFEVLNAGLPRNPNTKRVYRGEGLDTKAVDRFLAAHAAEHRDQPLCLILGDNGPHVVWEKNQTYDPLKLPIPPNMVDTPKTRTALANYYQDITSVDKRLGEVLASVRQHGFEANTLFIYTSDQGPEWPHCKWTAYDTGLKVPFIARWPGVLKPATVNAALISFVDVVPTFIDLAGGTEAKLDGRSFKNVLLKGEQTFRDQVFATHTGDGEMNRFPQRCVRDPRYKYVLNLHPERTWTTHFTKVPGIPDSHAEVWNSWVEKAKTDPASAKLVAIIEHHTPEELYDTQSDPYELNNLAGRPEMKARIEKMRAEVKRWMAEQGDAGMD
jgi:N-sulfoglucosamine sulfohydrolase